MQQVKRLTLQERYTIAILLGEGYTKSGIARRLNRARTTIAREIERNSFKGVYDADKAHLLATERQKSSHIAVTFTSEVRDLVEDYVRQDWSPEQVSNYLKMEYSVSVSVERIYQHIKSDRFEGGDLYTHLRRGYKKYRKKYGKTDYRGQIKERVSIDERPAIVDEKSRIGDWEVDTVIGKNHKGAFVTAVERVSKLMLVGKVDTKEAKVVGDKLVELLRPYKKDVHTITGDNGKEFADHIRISQELQCDFYFAHPYASWERGLNENSNGLLRQYFPKGSSFENVTEDEVNRAEKRLNGRPRKTLEYQKPCDVFLSRSIGAEKYIDEAVALAT